MLLEKQKIKTQDQPKMHQIPAGHQLEAQGYFLAPVTKTNTHLNFSFRQIPEENYLSLKILCLMKKPSFLQTW